MDTSVVQAWMFAHTETVRVLLLVCCLGYVSVAYRWLRPGRRVVRRSLLAAFVQFWVGLVADIALVESGAWTYRDLPLALAGVPVDLHLDWALLWGLALAWLSERWPGRRGSRRDFGILLAGAVLLTVAFDVTIADWLLFIERTSAWWLLADLGFLTVVLGLTLWVHHSPPGGAFSRAAPVIPPASPRLRAWLYASGFALLFVVAVPEALYGAAAWLELPVPTTSVPVLPAVLATLGLALGVWSVDEFARRGDGTPVPWDPPRRLVVTGPYAFVANPIQLAVGALMTAALLQRLSWLCVVYLVDVALVVSLVLLVVERGDLESRFGATWRGWRRAVPLWRMRADPALPRRGAPILFFDDGCGLCSRWVSALLHLDRRSVLRLAPLGGETARALLGDDAVGGGDARSVILYEPATPGGAPALVSRSSRAVLRVTGVLPMPLALLAALAAVPGLPIVADRLYAAVSSARHRFGTPPRACALRILVDPRRLP